MARKLRVECPGAICHVMNRGDRRAPIFQADADRELFLETPGRACAKTGWRVHACCLRPNHFHLVVETPPASLVAGMKWLLGTDTGRFNRRHRLFGHLFSGRYKSPVVDGGGGGHLKTVCDHAHLNPVRAEMIGPAQKLTAYRWSSYRQYLMVPRRRCQWLRVDRLPGEHGVPQDSAPGRKHFAAAMEARRQGEPAQELKAVRRGWCLGDKAFRQELLGQMQGRRGAEHYGGGRFEPDGAKALSILEQELKRRGWKPGELKARRKGDKNKAAMAARLRRGTTMTLKWMAQQLGMGGWNNVSNRLAALRKRKRP